MISTGNLNVIYSLVSWVAHPDIEKLLKMNEIRIGFQNTECEVTVRGFTNRRAKKSLHSSPPLQSIQPIAATQSYQTNKHNIKNLTSSYCFEKRSRTGIFRKDKQWELFHSNRFSLLSDNDSLLTEMYQRWSRRLIRFNPSHPLVTPIWILQTCQRSSTKVLQQLDGFHFIA